MSGRGITCAESRLLGVFSQGVSAEYVAVPVANVVKKPEGPDFVEAAALGVTYTTAWRYCKKDAESRPRNDSV